MMSLVHLEQLVRLEFFDIVREVSYPTDYKLRCVLMDDSLIDIYLARINKTIFAFHWERRHLDGTIYRYDNYPHKKWKSVKTFPYHFHEQQDSKVVATQFRKKPKEGLYDFLTFVRQKLLKKGALQ